MYRIVRELGHGGMGLVYLAERSDGKFDQTVALKLLKREMNSVTLRRSFEREAEILASSDHPNIARMLDTGVTEDDIPYIVMEFVKGLPIDLYCSINQVTLEERETCFGKFAKPLILPTVILSSTEISSPRTFW